MYCSQDLSDLAMLQFLVPDGRLRFWGSGFGGWVQGLGCGVQGLGFRFQGLGFGIQGLGFRV